MSVTGFASQRKRQPWRDKSPRTLREAAQAACDAAAAEHLPLHAVLGADALSWHAQSILRTIPVQGMRNGVKGRVPTDGVLSDDLSQLDQGTWSELKVERHDFDSYLAWMRTVW